MCKINCWLFFIFAAPLLMAQHEKDGKKTKHPFIGDPAAIEAGRKTFANGCGACHGPDGKGGRGPNLRERTSWHPMDDDTLYSAIQKGIGGAMPAANLSEDQAWQVVAFVRALTAPAIETPLAKGNAEAGRQLFTGKAGCAGCHRIRGSGGGLGPDLTNIGATRALSQLREAILDPESLGAAQYRGVEVLLKNGKRLKGVARNRTNYSLQLQDKDGNMHLIDMLDVTEMKLSDGSPMPRNYKDRLNADEIDNLLAYLREQSVRPYSPESKSKSE
jgi:cytochrome c oxidase cbb3-type subunit III